jgi:hypothetical protein
MSKEYVTVLAKYLVPGMFILNVGRVRRVEEEHDGSFNVKIVVPTMSEYRWRNSMPTNMVFGTNDKVDVRAPYKVKNWETILAQSLYEKALNTDSIIVIRIPGKDSTYQVLYAKKIVTSMHDVVIGFSFEIVPFDLEYCSPIWESDDQKGDFVAIPNFKFEMVEIEG